MRIGKLSNQDLENMIISRIEPFRDDVLLRPGIGVDCGGVQMDGDVCILSTDPITAASKDAGRLAVHVSCNDAAAAGAEPVGLLLTMLIPTDMELDEVGAVFQQAQECAQSLNVEIIGGHTEVTDAVNRLVINATVIGRAADGKYFSAQNAQNGDAIIVTKFAGMEGTAIIAADYPHLLENILNEKEMKRCGSLAHEISVVREGLLARELPVTAMHDVTEGGVLGAVWELCSASGMGALISLDKVPVLRETRLVCNALGLDPLKLISSGCMLMTSPDGAHCVNELKMQGIVATVIGKVKPGNVLATQGGQTHVVDPPDKDEIYRL